MLRFTGSQSRTRQHLNNDSTKQSEGIRALKAANWRPGPSMAVLKETAVATVLKLSKAKVSI